MTISKISTMVQKTKLLSLGLSVLLFGSIVQSSQVLAAKESKSYYNPSSKLEKLSAYSLHRLNGPFSSWGVNPVNKSSAINLAKAWRIFKKKEEIVVAVIDTGIDPNHNFLKENIITQKNAFGVDFSKSEKSYFPYDSHGHGTHVSGIIKSVYPDVKIIPLKYYAPTKSGQENLDATIKALSYAVEKNVDVINYSGGGPEPSLDELKILKEAERKGILVIAAAGNEQSNIDIKNNSYYPASYNLSNIITVTAHDQNLKILNSSNWGRNTVTISAPGKRINSAIPNQRAGFMTGTSQATAFVSGVVAMLLSENSELTPLQIKNILVKSSKKHEHLAKKCLSSGILDAYKAIKIGRDYKASSRPRKMATYQ
jgi:subtilisin family serine protease